MPSPFFGQGVPPLVNSSPASGATTSTALPDGSPVLGAQFDAPSTSFAPTAVDPSFHLPGIPSGSVASADSTSSVSFRRPFRFTPEDVDSTSTTPKKLKPTQASTAKASKKDVAKTAVADQGSTVVEGMRNTSDVSTTPLAKKIQNMAMSENPTPTNDTGTGLQASDDDGGSAVSTVVKAAKMRKITSTASDRRTVVPLADEVADAWGFSQFTTFKAKKLADVNDGATIAMRHLPRGLQYGIVDPQRDRLVLDAKLLTLLLVGRVASTYVEEAKSVASVHVVPLLEWDLVIANNASGDYSIPRQVPTKYTTVHASCAQQKAKGSQRYELFKAVYDVTKKEIKPKDQMEAYDIRNIEPGDLVALELNVEKFTNRAQVQQASYDLKAILLLRKGKAEDSEIIAKATEPEATDNFSGSFYADVSSPIKGKRKART
ncbi:hypothetical protein FRC04_006757 [Tulasnella sp. 424]|nr:hypothetical protein FRC04_006757 [Tulasnella sp. 424]KAG8974307.1 hypothetical protein FRC05_007613 [Tulasnella sp. 425]